MAEFIVGGQALTAYFRAKINATSDGYDIVKLDGTTAATTGADAALKLILSDENKPTPSSDGLATIDHGNFQCDEEVDTFVETMRPDGAATSDVEEKYSDDGTKYGGGAATADKLLVGLHYGGKSPTTGKVRLTAVFGGLDPTSGGGGSAKGKMAAPVIKMAGAKNTYAVTITKTLLDTTKVAEPTANLVIPAGRCWKVFWLAEPA